MQTAKNIEEYMIKHQLSDWEFASHAEITWETLQNIKFGNFKKIRSQTSTKLEAIGIEVPDEEKTRIIHKMETKRKASDVTIDEYLIKNKLTVSMLARITGLSEATIWKHRSQQRNQTTQNTLNRFLALGITLPHITSVRGDDLPYESVTTVDVAKEYIDFIKDERIGYVQVDNKKQVMVIKKFCRDNFYHFDVTKSCNKYKVRFKRKNVNRQGFDRIVL